MTDGWKPIETAPRIPYAKIDLWVVPGRRYNETKRSPPYREPNAYSSGNLRYWCDSKGQLIEGRHFYNVEGKRCFDPDDRGPDATIVTYWRELPESPK